LNKKIVLFVLLVASGVAAASCKLLFKSDYAELKASDLAAVIEGEFPEMQVRQIAQNKQARKQLIDNFKQMFSLAQAAEDEGLHKSDKFKKQMEITTDRALASEHLKRNPDVVVPKEEMDAYYASHKDRFEDDFKFTSSLSKQPVTDDLKEQQRVGWSEIKVRAEKARQGGLDKDLKFTTALKFRRANLLASLYNQELEEKNQLTDAEKKKYLAENPNVDPDKLKEKAQGLLDRVKNGESFEKLAGEFSDDPGSKQNGGDLGWFGKGMMDPPFEAAAFALQKGQTTNELVKSRFGYHIIRVEDRRMAQDATNPAPATSPEPKQEPREEVHARHILIDTRGFETYQTEKLQEKMKRAHEDATLKFPVIGPEDFVLNVPGLDRNRIPGLGGGQGGRTRNIDPQANK
jgi:parvulin-like peptidyl-prolyl isomerase